MSDELTTSNNQAAESTHPSLAETGHSEEEQLAARANELRQQIEEANYQYYVNDNPMLTDAEYDQLMLELQPTKPV